MANMVILCSDQKINLHEQNRGNITQFVLKWSQKLMPCIVKAYRMSSKWSKFYKQQNQLFYFTYQKTVNN